MKQVFALLLATLMLVACVACGGGDSGSSTTTDGTPGTTAPGGTTDGGDVTPGTTVPGTTEINLDPGFENQDFDGEKLVFLTQDRGTNYQEFGVFEDSANNVASAVY